MMLLLQAIRPLTFLATPISPLASLMTIAECSPFNRNASTVGHPSWRNFFLLILQCFCFFICNFYSFLLVVLYFFLCVYFIYKRSKVFWVKFSFCTFEKSISGKIRSAHSLNMCKNFKMCMSILNKMFFYFRKWFMTYLEKYSFDFLKIFVHLENEIFIYFKRIFYVFCKNCM